MAEKKNLKKTEKENSEVKKLSYEQLEQIAGNLNAQCRELSNQLNNAQRVIAEFNEIGMLLDILGKSEYFSHSFVDRCASKIETIITNVLNTSEEKKEE